jgi:hypothetical protein
LADADDEDDCQREDHKKRAERVQLRGQPGAESAVDPEREGGGADAGREGGDDDVAE